MEKNSMKNNWKIVIFIYLIYLSSYQMNVFWWDALTQDKPKQFNYEYNKALKYEWTEKVQESSWMTLFQEAREKVQAIKNTQEDTKPTELLHNMWNDFCQGLFGNCDQNSIYARLLAWCDTARDTAFTKMDSNFIRNNTEFLIGSYTDCQKLARDVIMAYKDSASVEIAWWQAEQVIDSQEKFTEKMQEKMQEKVTNMWDVFKKKLTNFVRSIQWITRNVNLRW